MTMEPDAFVLPQSLCTTTVRGNVALVNLTTRALRERQAAALLPHLNHICDEFDGRVVIDASRVDQFTCAWINTLIGLTRRCRTLGGDLFVAGLPRYARDLFHKTGIEQHLHMVTSPDHALGELGLPTVAPWRLAVARLLDIPIAIRAAA